MDALQIQNPTKLVEFDGGATDKLIAMWVHGKSPHTQRYYLSEARRFLLFVGKPLDRVNLQDTQAYADYLAQGKLAAGSQRRSLSAIKSLFTFAQRKLGIFPVNAAAPVTLPKQERKLAERILPKNIVEQLIKLEPNKRNQFLLKLLYKAGLRVSELCALKWRNLQPRFDGGQVTVFGKGGKTRAVLLTFELWQELMELRGTASMEEPVFISRKKHGHLNQPQINKIVKAAAKRVPGLPAEIAAHVSPHWLRHAHASHSLDNGAPIHLVQQTLGHASVATTGLYLHANPNDSSVRYL